MSGLNNVDVSVTSPDIESWFGRLDSYASGAISNAAHVASGLNGFYEKQYSPEVAFDPIVTSVSLGQTVPKPVAPSLSVPNRNFPSAPSISSKDIIVGDAPIFTEPDPSLNMPATPSPLSILPPSKDFTINTSFDYPTAPSTTDPTLPSLVDIVLPTLESINIPTFSLAFPTSNATAIPGVTFAFNEVYYSSPLLSGIKDALLSRITGGTGLTPIVEAAIWNRGRDREQRASLQAERTLLVERGQMGLSRPSGATRAALDQIVQDTQSKMIELSREIMIKQAELEQENIKNSIQQAIALEDILIREKNNINQRSFEVAKYVQDLQIELFKLAVSKFESEIAAYTAYSTTFKIMVEVELNKLDIYKGLLDGERLKGEINKQKTDLYLAQWEGVKAKVAIYKELIAAISERIKGESLKLDVFKSDIDAYSAQVSAKASEYTIYSEQIKGELAKTQVFDSKVKAFASKIQGYASIADVAVKRSEVDATLQGLNIKKYEADIEAFIKLVQSDQIAYQNAVELYKGQSQLYLADIGLGRANAELALKQADNTIEQNKYKADISIENAKITLASLQASYNATLEGKKAAGSIYSQIGSSALAAINVSAGVNGSVSVAAQEQHVYSDQ